MGRDWGEVIEVKVNFVQMLHKQLEKRPRGTFGLGTVTDPYQSLENEFELSRGSLGELRRAGSPVSVLTKSDLILRDLDIFSGWKNTEVGVSIASVDDEVCTLLEPGAPRPGRRLDSLRKLSEEGVDAYAMVAPIVPGVSDSEKSLRDLVRKVAETGTKRIMWDKFNPKPLAGARLRRTLADKSIEFGKIDGSWVSVVRGVLLDECKASSIELLDAF